MEVGLDSEWHHAHMRRPVVHSHSIYNAGCRADECTPPPFLPNVDCGRIRGGRTLKKVTAPEEKERAIRTQKNKIKEGEEEREKIVP